MTQSRSAKQTTSVASSFLPDKPLEIKRLQTVISDEELDITIETLKTLSQHPSLTKSKLCRDLRTAVYDFRLSCATGINSITRISAALYDEKYLEARILLSEMRLRGEEPKLGSLCRWVRDLDVVTQPTSINSRERSPKDNELLKVLDAVLRVSCPVDFNTDVTKLLPGSSSHIAFQPTWDLRSSTQSHQVYDSVLDGSIFCSTTSSIASSLRIIETTPGHLRNPPNYHPAILYTSLPHTIPLSSECPRITHHKHPKVPNLSLATNVLTPAECKAIIAIGESVGFLPDTPIRDSGDTSILAHNFYWICQRLSVVVYLAVSIDASVYTAMSLVLNIDVISTEPGHHRASASINAKFLLLKLAGAAPLVLNSHMNPQLVYGSIPVALLTCMSSAPPISQQSIIGFGSCRKV
ncbi:prolyl 4-hydroxylase [Trichoderma cornu-damae]|uniref:Prolyl 4-hydroxylase n=1 Tax=Trichoderma cornu-damae TaxID=654480 RepID=A0A9P8QKU4_9HYPO|nr:prolyl 4-hydroxylase [Trichoderma cornu-damae]